jgi:hypothetical protein
VSINDPIQIIYIQWGIKQYTIIAFIWGEHLKLTTSRGLTTLCSTHLKAITVLLSRNYFNMFKTWMFYVVEDNKIIFGFRKYNCETGLKKKRFSTHFLVSNIVDLGPRATTYCLLSHYVCYVNLERLVTNFITYYSVQTLQVKEKNLIPKYCFNRSNALKLS